MKTTKATNRLLLAFMLILASLSPAAFSVAAHADDADHTAPTYDMKAQALLDLETMQKKFVHLAGERYGILNLMGAEKPEGFNGKTFEKSTTDRAQIVTELNKSWAFTQKTIQAMPNAEFAKLLPKLGPQANAGDVIYILVADAHEHLGQSVAYARENGIVPPWTVEAQKKAAEQKAGQK